MVCCFNLCQVFQQQHIFSCGQLPSCMMLGWPLKLKFEKKNLVSGLLMGKCRQGSDHWRMFKGIGSLSLFLARSNPFFSCYVSCIYVYNRLHIYIYNMHNIYTMYSTLYIYMYNIIYIYTYTYTYIYTYVHITQHLYVYICTHMYVKPSASQEKYNEW